MNYVIRRTNNQKIAGWNFYLNLARDIRKKIHNKLFNIFKNVPFSQIVVVEISELVSLLKFLRLQRDVILYRIMNNECLLTYYDKQTLDYKSRKASENSR